MANSLTFNVYGEDKTASKTLKKVGTEAESTGKKVGGLGKLGGSFSSLGKGVSAGLAGLMGGGVVAGLLGTTKSFESLVGQVKGLQKVSGGTVTEASHLRSEMALSGVDATQGTVAMRKFSVALGTAAKSQKTAAAMSKLMGVNFLDAHGKIIPMAQLLPKLSDKFKSMPAGAEKTALAVKLFGKNGTEMIPFLNKGAAGMAELDKKSDAMGLTLSGSAVDAVTKSKVANRDFAAALQGLSVTVGSMLLPAISTLMMFFTSRIVPIIQKVTAYFNTHRGMLKLVATAVAVLVVALTGFKILSSITKGMAALNLVMAANPVGLIIVAVAALVAGFLYLWNNCKPFREFFIRLWLTIKLAVTTAVTAVVGAVSAAWNAIKGAWHNIGTFFSGLLGNIKSWVSGLWSGLLGIGVRIVMTINNGINSAVSALGRWFAGLWNSIYGWVAGLWGSLTRFGDRIVGTIVYGIYRAWSGLARWFTGLWASITGWVAFIWPMVKNSLGGRIIRNIVAGISAAWGTLARWFTGLWTSIYGWVAGVWRMASAIGGRIIRSVVAGISAVWGTLSRWFTGLWTAIYGWVSAVWQGAVSVGSRIVRSVVSGISAVWGTLARWFTGLWTSIYGWVANVWGMASGIGGRIIGSVVSGISSAWGSLAGWFTGLWVSIYRWVSGVFANIRAWGGSLVAWLSDGIGAAWNTLASWFTGLWGDITGWFGSILQNAYNWGSDFAQHVLDGIGDLGSKIAQKVVNLGGGSPFQNLGINGMPGMKAKGGPLLPNTFGTVGEQGMETYSVDAGGRATIYSNPSTQGGLRPSAGGSAFRPGNTQGGNTTVVHVHVNGLVGSSADHLAKQIVDTLTGAQRRGVIQKGFA